MAKKKPFSKKQLERQKVQEAKQEAIRVAKKEWRRNASDEELREHKAKLRRERIKRDRREEYARCHSHSRRYVWIAENVVTGKIQAYHSQPHQNLVWSSTHVTLHDSSRYYRWSNTPQLLLQRLAVHEKQARNAHDMSNWKFYMVRAGSKNCPIKIDYATALRHNNTPIASAPFIVKK